MSRSPARPTLLPSVRRLWRGSNQLQLGTDPGRAVMLDLTDPASARVLDLLDGTRTEQALLRETARLAISADDVHMILDHLRQAGYVVDLRDLRPAGSRSLGLPSRRRLEREAAALAFDREPPARVRTPAVRLRRRRSAHVLISGTRHLVVPIATTLAAAGIGHLDPVAIIGGEADSEPDLTEAVRRSAPEVDLAPMGRGRAGFAVLVGAAAPASLTALSYRRMAHLAVTIREGAVIVGPLVRPGRTPCLNCLDLHRADRDPAWRLVAAQLLDSPGDEPVASTTALAGAAFAAQEVLTHIDGGVPRTLGATVEITGPADTIRRRWTHHPACGCVHRQRNRRTEPPAVRT